VRFNFGLRPVCGTCEELRARPCCNSFGPDGARCIADAMRSNSTVEALLLVRSEHFPMMHPCLIFNHDFIFRRTSMRSAPMALLRLQKRCSTTAPCSGWTLCVCVGVHCCVQFLSRCIPGAQRRPRRCRMPPRRLHPAQPQAHRAGPRPRTLRLRWARGVAGRGAARSARRSCGQGVDGGARVVAEGLR
jgi:hypothetical protein